MARQKQPGRQFAEVASKRGALAGVRVLIVDDNADARVILQAVFEYCDAEVFVADTGRAALEMVRRAAPHVVICDIAMPHWNGYRVLREIRALPGERGVAIPVIAVTAYEEQHHGPRALAAGFTAWRTKPVNLADLVALVEDLAKAQHPPGRADPDR
jgi:CheY-like chemotaxis protein